VSSCLLAHYGRPLRSATDIANDLRVSIADVRSAYQIARESRVYSAAVRSPFYEHKLAYSFASTMLAQWADDESELRDLLLNGRGASRTVEIHPTKDTCGYRCTMCLWSDRSSENLLPLRPRSELMSTSDWISSIDQLAASGVKAIVVSGGGEPLLNPDIGQILRHCRLLRLSVDIYTTGYQLLSMNAETLSEIGQVRNLRLSIHSPFESTYSRITGLPVHTRPLERVIEGARRLRSLATGLRIGAGFVVQPDNFCEIADMIDFTRAETFDYLQIRAESVDATESLGEDALVRLRGELRDAQLLASVLRFPTIDMSDDLTRLANGQPLERSRDITGDCWAKAFRPTIDPAGVIAPCDLKAEPRFRVEGMFLGRLDPENRDAFQGIAQKHVPDDCAQCMPSSRSGNAIWTKLRTDLAAGIQLTEQPFAAQST
jgi:MoaA/NifB/PqqE/SkfB family radical SAM enzyme